MAVHGHWLFCSFLYGVFAVPFGDGNRIISVQIKKAQMCEYRSVYMAAEKERKINYIIRKELTYKLPHNTGKEME